MPFDVEPLRRQLRQQQRAFAREASREVQADLKVAAPKDTNELMRSITTSNLSVSDNRIEFTAQTGDLIQAETTEHGARPHPIVARNARALRFQIGGQTIIVKRVNHPGNPARPWFYPTLEQWPQIAERVWRRVSR